MGAPELKIDVESLRTLRAVVDSGSFTVAADDLGMTQSAVSHKVKRLEERVGLDLVVRGAVVTATPDGADLLRFADRIVSAHDEAVAHLTRSDLEGALRLGSNEDLHSDELVEVLARFGRAYPNVHIEVTVGLSGTIADMIDGGEVDLGLLQVPTTGPQRPRTSDTVVRQERIAWVVAPGVEFDPDQPLPLLSYGSGWTYGDAVSRALGKAGWEVRTALTCPSVGGVQSAVEAGLGVAVINERNYTTRMTHWSPGATIELPPICSVLRSGVSPDRPENPALDALRRELAAQFSPRSERST
ncbi:MAG: LysR substrate-binding domain-containing protein [Actinomycetota bacterium]